jgi:NADH-quinone oxidoreductase subunit J
VAIFDHPIQFILSVLLILSSLGVILSKKPVHSCLYFLMTLMILASLYLQLSAQFIAIMQILVYAGAILVTFMFVMVLFQDAHEKINLSAGKCSPFLILAGISTLALGFLFFGRRLESFTPKSQSLTADFGTVESLGKLLYTDYFLPFEAMLVLFLIASVGALYIGRKET